MNPPDDYASLKTAATQLVEAGKEEQRRLVDEHWDVITALTRWSPESPDRDLYESMSRLVESAWFSSVQDRARATNAAPTESRADTEADRRTESDAEGEAPGHDLNLPSLIDSMAAVADALEQLNSHLDTAQEFIAAANQLIDTLDAAEAAQDLSVPRDVPTAPMDLCIAEPTAYRPRSRVTDPLSRSSSPGCVSLDGWLNLPTRTPSPEGTQAGSVSQPPRSLSPDP
ncbi:hypothetical protein GGG16DRAFT_119148 [Schizophyllum commune]